MQRQSALKVGHVERRARLARDLLLQACQAKHLHHLAVEVLQERQVREPLLVQSRVLRLCLQISGDFPELLQLHRLRQLLEYMAKDFFLGFVVLLGVHVEDSDEDFELGVLLIAGLSGQEVGPQLAPECAHVSNERVGVSRQLSAKAVSGQRTYCSGDRFKVLCALARSTVEHLPDLPVVDVAAVDVVYHAFDILRVVHEHKSVPAGEAVLVSGDLDVFDPVRSVGLNKVFDFFEGRIVGHVHEVNPALEDARLVSGAL